jgi:hypothetical protein
MACPVQLWHSPKHLDLSRGGLSGQRGKPRRDLLFGQCSGSRVAGLVQAKGCSEPTCMNLLRAAKGCNRQDRNYQLTWQSGRSCSRRAAIQSMAG